VNRSGRSGKEEGMGAGASDAEAILASVTDPERFTLVFDRHFPAIHGYLQRRIGPGVAEDLAAEAFVTAFRRREDYDASRASALPWLFGIAANLLRHRQRKERRGLLAFARTGVDPVVEEFGAVDDRVDAQLAGPRLARALASLTPGDREVLLLYAWADLTYAEIAEALNIPIGTVRSRLSRARGSVRELLASSGQLPDEVTLEGQPNG
jgi:RNA polymerase sigma factor (sigma-70 family)